MVAVTKAKPTNRITNANGADLPVVDAPSSKKKAEKNGHAELGQLVIPRVEFQWARIEIIGDSPLIVNRFRESALANMEEAQQGAAKQKKPPREPELEFFESNHICKGFNDPKRMKDCLFGFPAIGIKKAIANAAYRFGGAKNIVSVASVLFISGPYSGLVPIYGVGNKKKGQPPAAMPHMRRDPVVLANGSASIAYRPEYSPWKMELDIRYWPSVLSLESLVNGLALAGQLVGIGAWRVENKGDKGMFRLGEVRQLPKDFVPEQHVAVA